MDRIHASRHSLSVRGCCRMRSEGELPACINKSHEEPIHQGQHHCIPWHLFCEMMPLDMLRKQSISGYFPQVLLLTPSSVSQCCEAATCRVLHAWKCAQIPAGQKLDSIGCGHARHGTPS